MEQFKQQVVVLRDQLSKSPVAPLLRKAESSTGVPYEYFVLGLAGFMVLLLFFGIGASLIWYVRVLAGFVASYADRYLFCSNIIGFVFPTYMSFKAIESEGKNDDTQW